MPINRPKSSRQSAQQAPLAHSQRRPQQSNALQLQIDDSKVVQKAGTTQSMADHFAGQRMPLDTTSAPIQMATAINHDTATFQDNGQSFGNFTVGIGMQATLDRTDSVKGSAPNNETSWMGQLNQRFNPRLQKAHLLNADLGGFGVAENLYPMTPKANRDHYNHVERDVKSALYRANINHAHFQANHANQVPGTEGSGVYYEVNIDGTHSYNYLNGGRTNLNAKAYYIDNIANSDRPNLGKEIVNQQIVSTPNVIEATPNFMNGGGEILNDWSHKRGAFHANSTNPQRQAMIRQGPKREGAVLSTNRFSLQTPNTSFADYRPNKVAVNDDLQNRPVLWTQANVASKLTDQDLTRRRNTALQSLKNHIAGLRVPAGFLNTYQQQADQLINNQPYRLTDMRALGVTDYFNLGLATNGSFPLDQALDLAEADVLMNVTLQGQHYSNLENNYLNAMRPNINHVEVVLEDLQDTMPGVDRAEEVTIYLNNNNSLDADFLVDNRESRDGPDTIAIHIANVLGINVSMVELQY